ncbi:MAG: hypothetical protein CFE24_07150 [Flavobacterium sp. BFFFF2]|nr:MAG: hypothetical protein CFE24_07150 [Flavobacterium sp. BFFFF2]
MKGEGDSLDFGERDYDPRIGRFWSIDRLQSKYPWMSPYSFVANNPIMNREIDGRDWTITTVKDDKGNTTIKMTLDVAVVNTSRNKTLDMHCLADAVKNQVQTSYSMTYKNDDGTTTTVEATVNARVLNDINELADNEHLVQVVNPGQHGVGRGYGIAPLNGKRVYLNEKYVDGIINGDDDNTVPHELGHTAGLKHADMPQHMEFNDAMNGQSFTPCTPCVENNVNNAMYTAKNPRLGGGTYLDDKKSVEINPSQIKVMVKNYDEGKLNKETKGQ